MKNIPIMKIAFIALFITFPILVFCQSVPEMRLKTSTFQPSTFTPTPYTPQTPNNSILQRSLQQREDRANKAYDVYGQLLELYSETSSAIPPSEYEWYEQYAGKMCSEVKDNIEVGNYSSATKMAYDVMSSLRNDKQIVYRKDSYKIYCDEISLKGSAYKNGKVNKETYDYWLYKNQYIFKPKYDLQGKINGYEPISVSWLYENINWNELRDFIMSYSSKSTNIDNLWDLYFMDSRKLSSLFQEFEVAKFYLEYYSYILANENITNTERESLSNQIERLKNLGEFIRDYPK